MSSPRPDPEPPVEAVDRPLSDAARRALAEAAERRAQAATARPKELRGRGGPDPVRYGDWEVKGVATDF